ncbi:MAG: DNA mismatch repair endonuclease MutL [Chloroflexi bacterium]|nr:DNA mismatch repair endonuclease MutL [Chloroflexota bacterium]
MPIRILDPQVAAKIAAGEVVERPASAVKELAENALDAGATRITIETQAGGLQLIRVTDDGQGIPVLDLELALERHATSKIARETDLDALATLGFRGEALPSVAAVSRLTLTSRARGEEQGAYVRATGGVLERKGAAGCPEGTVVTVQDIFTNVPARRKFLRSEAAEAGRIHRVVAHLALAYPGVRFQLIQNGKETFLSPGDGDLRRVLAQVYDDATADGMLEAQGDDGEGRSVYGYISPPGIHRANRSAISHFVNRRWVLSPMLVQAVEEAYRGLLMEGRHPLVCLHLELPPAEVDANVHPTKQEVRFQKEGAVFSLVQRALRGVLVAQSPVPSVAAAALPALPPFISGPFSTQPGQPFAPRVQSGRQVEFALGLAPTQGPPQPGQAEAAPQPGAMPLPDALPALRVLGQAGATYIIAEGPQGVYLIDQHAAHERVRYEQVQRQVKERQPDVQGLLEPLPVELSPAQVQALDEWKDMVAAFGFQGEPFGERSYLLRGVPGDLRDAGPQALLSEALDLLARAVDPVRAADALAASIACHSAVRAGDLLSHQEMTTLVRQLEGTQSPHTCPHGRPTMLHLSATHLEREFGRR